MVTPSPMLLWKSMHLVSKLFWGGAHNDMCNTTPNAQLCWGVFDLRFRSMLWGWIQLRGTMLSWWFLFSSWKHWKPALPWLGWLAVCFLMDWTWQTTMSLRILAALCFERQPQFKTWFVNSWLCWEKSTMCLTIWLFFHLQESQFCHWQKEVFLGPWDTVRSVPMTPGEQVDFCPWFVLANSTCYGDKKMMVWLACSILNF